MTNPIGNLNRPPRGPDMLFAEVRPRVHSSVSDETVLAVIVPTVSYLAMLTRQRHLDTLLWDTAPALSWQDVCDWLVQVIGREIVGGASDAA